MKILGSILIIVSLFVSYTFGVGVKATVNTEEVMLGGTLQLTLKGEGKDIKFPSIVHIVGNKVLQTSSSSQSSITIVNGQRKTVQSISKILLLKPKKSFTIPAYEITIEGKVYKTNPILIKVTKSQAPKVNGKAQYSFLMQSSKTEMVVGESFVLKLYISLSRKLGVQQIGEYVPPASNTLLFKEVGGQKQYQRGNYIIVEKTYMVTPQQEGNISISNASAQIGLQDRTRQDFFGRYGVKWIQISSNSLKIKVHSQPSNVNLVGEFELQDKVDVQKIKANKPVNFTITLKGKGSLEDFEFPKLAIDGVTIYSDDATIKSHVVGNQMISNYSKSFALICDTNFTIPSQKIVVYNPKTKQVQTLISKSYSIEVEPTTLNSFSSPSGVVHTKNILPPQKTKIVEKIVEIKVLDKRFIISAFFLGMFVLWLLQKLMGLKGRKRNNYNEKEALKLLYGHISKSSEIEEMVKKLYARKNGDKSVQIDKKALKKLVDEVSKL